MELSRRSTLAYGSVLAAAAHSAVPAFAHRQTGFANSSGSQLVQHLVIHEDEAEGGPYCAAISFSAPDTAWKTAFLTGDDFKAADTRYGTRGYGLRRLSAFETKHGTRYAAIWQLGFEHAANVRHDMTLTEFRGDLDRFAAAGYSLSHVDAHATALGPRFAAIWSHSRSHQRVIADLTAAQFNAQRDVLAAEGMHPVQVAGYATANEPRFVAVFAGDADRRQVDLAVAAVDFHRHSMLMMSQGHRLLDTSGYVIGKQPFYTAVWQRA